MVDLPADAHPVGPSLRRAESAIRIQDTRFPVSRSVPGRACGLSRNIRLIGRLLDVQPVRSLSCITGYVRRRLRCLSAADENRSGHIVQPCVHRLTDAARAGGRRAWTLTRSTLQAARFYVPALGAISLLGAWLLVRVPRRQPLVAVTTLAVVAALFGPGGWAFHDMYQFPFGPQLVVVPGPGGTIELEPGPGAMTGGP